MTEISAAVIEFTDEDLRAILRVCQRSDHQWRDRVVQMIKDALTKRLDHSR